MKGTKSDALCFPLSRNSFENVGAQCGKNANLSVCVGQSLLSTAT